MIAALSESGGGRGLRGLGRHGSVLIGAPDAGAQSYLATGRKRYAAREYMSGKFDGAASGRHQPEAAMAPDQAIEAGLMGRRRIIFLAVVGVQKHPFLAGAGALVFVTGRAESQFDRAGMGDAEAQPRRRRLGAILAHFQDRLAFRQD